MNHYAHSCCCSCWFLLIFIFLFSIAITSVLDHHFPRRKRREHVLFIMSSTKYEPSDNLSMKSVEHDDGKSNTSSVSFVEDNTNLV